MAKIIQINTVSKKALKNMLPMGAFVEIHKRLEKKGHKMHYNTVKNAFSDEYNVTDNHKLVLQEAVDYLEETKDKRKLRVSDELEKQLAATGS